jgi:lysophospholipase L1-like esterase
MNAACSGATAGDLVTSQRQTGRTAPVDTAFSYGIPAVITITSGANDLQWDYFLKKCYISRCGTAFDRAYTQSFLTATKVKLNYAMSQIDRKGGSYDPKVLLTGYYVPFSQACTAITPRISAAEITWMNHQVELLNGMISETAGNFWFASFVPVNFSGHELCSSEPWIQGLNDQAPFHPTAGGQKAYADAIIAQIR